LPHAGGTKLFLIGAFAQLTWIKENILDTHFLHFL